MIINKGNEPCKAHTFRVAVMAYVGVPFILDTSEQNVSALFILASTLPAQRTSDIKTTRKLAEIEWKLVYELELLDWRETHLAGKLANILNTNIG